MRVTRSVTAVDRLTSGGWSARRRSCREVWRSGLRGMHDDRRLFHGCAARELSLRIRQSTTRVVLAKE